MAGRGKKKLAVGDVFESERGQRVVVAAVDERAGLVSVELTRTVFTRSGELLSDSRERSVPLGLWPSFIQAYRKVKA